MSQMQKIYSCTKCGAQSLKWSGRCLECGSWGTLSEEFQNKNVDKKNVKISSAEIINLDNIESSKLGSKRLKTKNDEIDRVFGGGIIPGSLTLFSGEPGVGKSTLLSQIINYLIAEYNVFYISGEESALQVKDRFLRLNCNIKKINFIQETNIEKVIAAILSENKKKENKVDLVIIDSIQTMNSSDILSEPGSISQIRACTVKFLELAKENDIAIVLVGHITKDGQIAGPKSLEHIVDTVIYLESDLKKHFRILRTTKNRFGSVNEIGIFEMTAYGFREVKNPSAIFLEDNKKEIAGSTISAIMEGSRPFFMEIQALVTKTLFGYPQRKASGFDANRLQVLSSVINKKSSINLNNQDIILNIIGGLKINNPSLDLAACFAILSALLDKKVKYNVIILGEVGLGGEIRRVPYIKEILKEAAMIGFKEAIIPKVNLKVDKIRLIKMENINEILNYL